MSDTSRRTRADRGAATAPTSGIAANDPTHLPVDYGLEQAVLGAIIAHPANAPLLRVADLLEPDHFHDRVHREIYTMIVTLNDAGKRGDPFTLSALLGHCEGPFEDSPTIKHYLGALGARAAHPERMRDYALELIDLQQRRIAQMIAEDLYASARDRKADLEFEDVLAGTGQRLDSLRAADNDVLQIVQNWSAPRPPREMLYPDTVPMREVTLFQGAGGGGKTTLGMQMASSVFLGLPWLGMKPGRQGRVMYVSAEEPEEDLVLHGQRITNHHGLTADHLDDDDFIAITLAGQSAILASCEPHGNVVQSTALWRRLRQMIVKRRPMLVVLDPLNDLFAVDLNSPTLARQCVQLLRSVCLEVGCALVLMGHPSIAGMQRGDGTSGSPAWVNSSRSQLYLQRIYETDERKVEPDPDVRLLSNKKLNHGRIGFEMRVRWVPPGVFVPDAPELTTGAQTSAAATRAADADRLFLELLAMHQARGLGDRETAPNYAPSAFAREPRADALARPGDVGEGSPAAHQGRVGCGNVPASRRGPNSARRTA